MCNNVLTDNASGSAVFAWLSRTRAISVLEANGKSKLRESISVDNLDDDKADDDEADDHETDEDEAEDKEADDKEDDDDDAGALLSEEELRTTCTDSGSSHCENKI